MKHRSAAFMFADTTPTETVGDGVRRQLFGFNDSILMARVEFEDGAVGDIHSHPHTQVSYVESGEFDVFIDGVENRERATIDVVDDRRERDEGNDDPPEFSLHHDSPSPRKSSRAGLKPSSSAPALRQTAP